MPRPPRICETCGQSFTNTYPVTNKYWAGRRFCSPACSQLGSRGTVRANRGRPLKSLEERFWSKVDNRGPKECWLWTGAKLAAGYGYMHGGPQGASRTRWLYAHRVSWELHNGPLEEGAVVCHHCDTPLCVNPYHLFIGTRDDNNKDRDRKGRGGHGVTVTHPREVIDTVIELHRQGMTQTHIAVRVGVSQQHVSRIVRGISRKNE